MLTAIAGSATTSCPALADRAIEVSTALIARRLNGFVAPAAGAALLFEPGQGDPARRADRRDHRAGQGVLDVDLERHAGELRGRALLRRRLRPGRALLARRHVAEGDRGDGRGLSLPSRRAPGRRHRQSHRPSRYARPFAAGIYDESSAGGITYRGAWRRGRPGPTPTAAPCATPARRARRSRSTSPASPSRGSGRATPRPGSPTSSLDGAPAGSVNPSGSSDREVLSRGVWPTPATHTVTITFDPGSRGGSSIALDAFVVLA